MNEPDRMRDILTQREISPTAIAALGQGLFYLVTGIWPLFSRRTFEKVTGPKVDFWLVQTAGVLISVIGSVLISAGLRRKVIPEIAALGIGSAVGLTGVDIVFTAKNRISPVYLLDALAEIGIITLWIVGITVSKRR